MGIMKKVLVFGVYPNFQSVLVRFFRQIGDFTVTYEREIADLPRRFREIQPDLVLYETNPKTEPTNQLKILVGLTEHRTPIIATGTSGDPNFQQNLLSDGVLSYLHRPFSEAVFQIYIYDALRLQRDVVRVVREIEFKPEQKQAGIAILAYFSRILESKYPGDRYAVAITQDEGKVTLEVRALDGSTERIEAALHAYGLVVYEHKPAEELLTDKFEVLALRNKLEMAALEVRQARELHVAATSNSEMRIEHLEDEVSALRKFLGDSLSVKRDEQRELIAFLTHLTATKELSNNYFYKF